MLLYYYKRKSQKVRMTNKPKKLYIIYSTIQQILTLQWRPKTMGHSGIVYFFILGERIVRLKVRIRGGAVGALVFRVFSC